MAKTKTTPKATVSGADLLAQLGVATKKDTKSKTPHISVTDPAQILSILAIVEGKEAVKEADSALKVAEEEFRDTATELYERKCQSDGTLHTSVRMVGTLQGQPLTLMYQQARSCLKMQEAEAKVPLQTIFGNRFYELFETKRTLSIKTESMNDNQITAVIQALQTALGLETFGKFVSDQVITSENLINPTEAFFGRRILDVDIRVLADRAQEEGFAQLKSSCFKL